MLLYHLEQILWVCDPDNEKKYSKRRNPKLGNMSKHYQIESTLTLTGSNADERIQIKPSEQAGLLSNLYNSLSGANPDKRIAKLVTSLKNAKSSIVVCNSYNKEVHISKCY